MKAQPVLHAKRSSALLSVKDSINALNDLADTLCLHKKSEGRELAFQALIRSRKIGYAMGMGDASHSIGLLHFRRNNDSALYYFFQARKMYAIEYPGMSKLAFTLNNISRTYTEQLRFDSALLFAQQGLRLASGSKDQEIPKKKWQMYSFGAMANAYAGLARYDSANAAYLNAIRLAEGLQQDRMLEVYFKGLSGIQSELGNFQQAADYAKKAISFIQDDDRALSISLANLAVMYSRLKNYEQADAMADSSLAVGKRSNVWNSVARNYSTLGTSRMEKKEYSAAMHLFKTGLKEALLHNNSKNSIGMLYIRLAEVYEATDSLPAAKQYYRQALQITAGDIETASDIYLALSRIAFRESKLDSAYAYLKRYTGFRDTVFTADKLRSITELNTRYATEKKDQELLLLAKEKQLQLAQLQNQSQQIARVNAEKLQQSYEIENYELETEKQEQLLRIQQLDIENNRIRQQEQEMKLLNAGKTIELEKTEKALAKSALAEQRNWFIFLVSGVLIAGLLLYLLFNRYRLQKKIQSQGALLLQREKISRELHDELGATLSGIAMYSHLLKEQIEKGNSNAVKQSVAVIQSNSIEMVNKLNDIVWLINPGKDSLQQLLGRLEDYAIQMAAVKGANVISNVHDFHSLSTLPAETRRNIYLLFKEAINNAVKYSNATQLELKVMQRKEMVEVVFSDNGDGLPFNANTTGNGLQNMKHRAEEIHALYSIDSLPGRGTSIRLSVPILH